jgi:heat-inducible transcriptional repressor
MTVDWTLNDRDSLILGAVVEEFVQTAEPVGSRHLTKKWRFAVSPATVRNVMADLEETGYLSQPHTSAGRIPTDRGYRYYVDHIIRSIPVPPSERRRLRRRIAGTEEIGEVLDSASRALSTAAHQLGVVIAPRFDSSVFRHIDFVLLRERRVLVILVARSGVIHHRTVDAPEVESQAELDRMAGYLNTLLEGVSLRDVKRKILAEMASEKALYDRLLNKALVLGSRAIEEPQPEGDLYLSDPAALFEHPEFNSVSKMRSLFEAFEKKSLILKILDRLSETVGPSALIGQENPLPDLQNCSIVTARYGREGQTLGTVGVIGPTRMDYRRILALVEYTARLLGEILDEM